MRLAAFAQEKAAVGLQNGDQIGRHPVGENGGGAPPRSSSSSSLTSPKRRRAILTSAMFAVGSRPATILPVTTSRR